MKKIVLLQFALLVCGLIYAQTDATLNESLFQLASEDKEWSGYDVYQDILQLGDLIKERKLFFIKTVRDGDTYEGWVDKDGMPNGILTITKPDKSVLYSAYKDGKPIAFGYVWEASTQNLAYGVFDKNVKINGPGSVFWPSGGHYVGYLTNNLQDGFGVTGRMDYNETFPEIIDYELTGMYSNGKIIQKLKDMPLAEYKKEAPSRLSKDLKVVSDINLGVDGIYTGNWKDGHPAGYGMSLYNIGATVGYRGDYGDTQGYYWTNEAPSSYEKIYYKNGYKYWEQVGKTDCFRRYIQSISSPIQYIYILSFARNSANRSLLISLFKEDPSTRQLLATGVQTFVDGYELTVKERDSETQTNAYIYNITKDGFMRITSASTVTIIKPDGTTFLMGRKSYEKEIYYGIVYYPNGQIYYGYLGINYQGELVKNGKGILMFDDGEVMMQGVFSNDVLSTTADIISEFAGKANFKKIAETANKYKVEAPTLSPLFHMNF